MSHPIRKAFPWLAIASGLAALTWALAFERLPPADFTYDNGNEIQTADPAKATGQPEHRVLNALFEGLLRSMPPERWQDKFAPGENVPMTPEPAMAERYEVSPDGLTYTFHLRKDAQWSSGESVTAEDFVWSWRRTLHPETTGKYAYQLYYLKGGEEYNTAKVDVGTVVEVELPTRRAPLQPFPRGTLLLGKIEEIRKGPKPKIPADAADEQKERIEAKWKDQWVYFVRLDSVRRSGWDRARHLFRKGNLMAVSKDPQGAQAAYAGSMLRALHVLPDFESTVGVKAEAPQKLVVTLKAPTPFFNELVAFYPYFPVNRRCVEDHGSPNWTKPENLVCNGPFKMEFRRIRDRIRFVKNPTYWDAYNVRLETIDAMVVRSETTTLNMFLDNQIDWGTQVPVSMLPTIKKKLGTQFQTAPELTVYFYRVNTTRPGLKNPLVRRALNLAIDKKNICEVVTMAGDMPATAIVPPGLPGYTSATGGEFNPAAARKLLEEAGYPGGQGLPEIEIMYNDLDIHKTIAERVQQLWRENLGIKTSLRGIEWNSYLSAQDKLDYSVCRAGWVGDYPDPNTFLDMWTSTSGQNQTGWSNEKFDQLIADAGREGDPQKRMGMLREAEQILLDESPILPIYWRVSKNLVKPHVQGWFLNAQDTHPLNLIWIDKHVRDAAGASR
jgi:oligopeptide transport system substrate-binding protein